MGSRETRGVDLNLLDRNISVKDWRAACVWPTETRPSACLRIVSGFEKGAIFEGWGAAGQTRVSKPLCVQDERERERDVRLFR